MGHRRATSLALAVVVTVGVACHDPDRIRQIGDPPVLAPPVRDGGLPPELDGGVPPEVDAGVPPEQVDAGPMTPDAGDPTPTDTLDGVPAPIPGVYTDHGPADEDAGIRGLVSFPIQHGDELKEKIRAIYQPASPDFRRYLTPQQWVARYAPPEEDVRIVADWIRSQGFTIPRTATNRLFFEFNGTVGQFNKAFDATVHVFERKSPQGGNEPHDVYGFVEGGIKVPKFVADRIHGVVSLDLREDPGPLPGEVGHAPDTPPADLARGLTPQQVARAYGFQDLYDQGYLGQGIRLGVVAGAHFRYTDLEGFWKSMGITRDRPKVVIPGAAPATRYRETALDLEWAGAMAPQAELIAYLGADARNTSMIFTFNEAIARGEVDVITDSFAHREDSEPNPMQQAYDHAATMAAAIGITVVSASGDSAGVDIPSSSPYVTAVGGTSIELDASGRVLSETAWEGSGSGPSDLFRTPWWQAPYVSDGKRGTVDVSLNADKSYWTTYLNTQRPNYGTSYASPIFGGMIAVIDCARAARGLPRVGYLNPLLYTDARVQSAFRDVTEGGTWKYRAGPGWDYPTGWGAPDARELFEALP